MTSPRPPLAPGAYRFTVKSAAEAVSLIRERLGPAARVLSVRAIEAPGWKRLFRAPALEVVAQVDPLPPPLAASAEAARGGDGGGATDGAERSEPPVARPAAQGAPTPQLGGLLRRSGLTETALNRLQAAQGWDELTRMPLHRALAETSRLLRAHAEARPERTPISRAAFLGTAGVGRTTALCKWLAQDVFRRARLGHVVSVEFERPNALGPLPVFSEALGVPLAHFPCATQPALPGGFVYFDLPGIAAGGLSANRALADFLDREQIAERVLVLNAAYDRASLREAYATGRDLGATHLVFTHLDEVPQWGKLWDYLFDPEIEPLFLSTGPSLTGDCEEDVPGAIVRRTLPDWEGGAA